MRVNPKKSHLGFQELRYLGFLVGKGQIRPLLEKVMSLHNSPRPGTKRQLRRFLGLVGYYSRFIPHFASIASPLTDALKHSKPNQLRWTKEMDHAFGTLHDSLDCQPVLRNPDFAHMFILQTDASDTGLGAVLSQETEGQEHPIMFLSRKLQTAERQYSTVEK